jgi:hypothetical protein
MDVRLNLAAGTVYDGRFAVTADFRAVRDKGFATYRW